MRIIKEIKPKIIVVCGPTGSGKTDLAISLCKKFGGEIVNADSRQVYKEMNIGTGKEIDKIVGATGSVARGRATGSPLRNTIQGIPIHLIDIASPKTRYSVGQFKKDAEKAIEDIVSRGKVPFVVGGTGLYVDALVENFDLPNVGAGLAPAQEGQPQARLPARQGLPLRDLVDLLKKIDPKAIDIVDLKNKRRVERALEYCLSTGKKFSESRKRGERKYEVLKLAPKISLDREKLYEKINLRVEKMIEEGLEKEVEMLAKKYGWGSEAMTGIGYREWKDYLANVGTTLELSLRDVIEDIQKNTRNYAKRQMTWFKRDQEINWVHPVKSSLREFDGVKDLKEVEKLVKKFTFL